MRKMPWLLPVLLVLAAACRNDPPPPGPVGEEASEGRVTPSGDTGPYVITRPKLDAYVGYQRRMLEVYGSLLKGLQGLGGLVDAGTPEAMVSARAGLKLIEAKAKAEADARATAGLSERDVNGIAEVVTAVISQRQLGRTLQYEEELKKLETLQAKMPPEQQAQLTPQVESMRQQVESFQKLAEARREYGDANVDVVLTREDDLVKNYQDMLRVFTGTRR